MTRFIIHIGPHKTGSTYLQNHLTHNRAALIGRGIYYPSEWTTPEIAWCHAELANLLQRDEFDAVARGFAELKAVGWPAIVLSSEDFSSLGEDQLRFLKECTGDEVEIVFFARRWSELLRSHGQEHIRQGGTKFLPEFIAQILTQPAASETINFALVLDRFATAFGPSRLKVLSYNNILKRGDNLFSYFAAKVLGIDGLPIISPTPAHASLSIENIELVRVLNVLRARHPGEIPWQMGNVVTAVLEHPLPHTRKAMAGSIAEIGFDGFAEPFNALYKWLAARYQQVIVKEAEGLDELLFDRQQSNLRYVDPNYLLDPAVLFELSNFLSELAGKWQPEPQAAPPQQDALPTVALAIEFSGSGNSGSYCAVGWSAPEQGWQWAVGPEASMLVPRPDRPGDYLLTVELRPFLARPHLLRQRMTIEVNGVSLASFEAGNPEPSVRSCIVPSEVVAKDRELAITFLTPDAARPADLGLPDNRKLSFAFHTLTLTPVGENCSVPGSDPGTDTAGEDAVPAFAAGGA
jgi:hypothetical protein